MASKTFVVVARFLVAGEGWVVTETPVAGSYELAGVEASKIARTLDTEYGDSHFWTVDLYGCEDGARDGLGSYYQLFHGRLS